MVSTELRRVLGMKAGMGMTVFFSDNGIVDWSLLDVSGYGAMVELTEVQESSFPASVLKRWSAECCQHVINTGRPVVPPRLLCPLCFLSLYRLGGYQLIVVWVPDRACIFQSRGCTDIPVRGCLFQSYLSDECRVGPAFH